jgi:K+-sensing histidine kinase KdpD
MVLTFIKAHGVEIKINTEDEGGAEFIVKLPIA